MEKAENTQIPVETQAARIFDLVCDIWKHDDSDVRQFVEEKIKPMPKEYLWALGRIVLISFIPSIIFLWLGFSMNSRWLIFLGGVWRAACTVLLLMALTPIGLIIEAVIGGKEGIGKRWVETISGTFIGELFFTLIVMILLPQMRTRLDLLPILIMTSMILGMAGGAAFGKSFIVPAAGAIFVTTLAFLIFPGPINALIGKIIPSNALEHFEIDLQELEEGKVVFFDQDGSPRAWYYLYVVDNKVTRIELFTREGYHPQTNVKLEPIDRRNARFILETKGQYLHPANIKKRGEKLAARAEAVGTSENRKPLPKKTLAVISPETSQQIDLSKPWKFRYEIFPGYQGHKRRAFSEWASARIEKIDSEVKMVIFETNGEVRATFSGNRKPNGIYEGVWQMTNLSGRGKFYLNAIGSASIGGSMQDETATDKRFVNIRFKEA